MIGVAVGGAEDGEQPVSDEFVRVSAVALDHRNDRLVELVQAIDYLLGGCAFGESCESPHVDE